MVRILQVIDGMNAGGMESMLMNYYRHLDRNNYIFDFLIFHKEKCFFEDEILNMGGKIYKITPRRENFLKNRKEVKDFFKNNRYDIVEFHQGITYFYPLIMAKKYGNKVRIIHNHGINRNYLKKLKIYNNVYARNRISGLATHYFTCSEEVNNQLFSEKVIRSKNINIVNNAIDVKKYSFNEEYRQEIRKEFKVNSDTELLCHIGTFTEPKNHKFLLEIFYEYLKLSPNAVLMLVGDGILKEEIIDKAKKLGIINNIILTGNRKDIFKIVSACDKFIFPSLYEGIPLVLIEAQSSGIPMFISNTINAKSFVTGNGLILRLEEKPEYWAKKIFEYSNLKDRLYYNKVMQVTVYNIVKEAKKLEKVYSKMTI